MRTIPSHGGRSRHSQADTDPMRHAGYRETVRAISDRYMALKGKPPLPRTESAWECRDDAAVPGKGSSEPETSPGPP